MRDALTAVIRIRWIAVAILATIACAPDSEPGNGRADGASRSATSAPIVATLDSITLVEDSSAFIAAPSAIAIAPDGMIAVADIQNRYVRVYDRDGRLRHTIGSPGRGPGELSMPSGLAFVSDTLLVVDDVGAQQLMLFIYPSGEYVGSMKRTGGNALTTVANGRSVWLGVMRASSGTTVTEWDVDTDSLRYHGTVPESYSTSERLRQVYGHVAAAVSDRAIYDAFVADSTVRVTDRQTGRETIHVIPERARRGTPADLAERLETTRRDEDYAGMASSLMALNTLADTALQLVHFDITFDRGLITAHGFVTTLDLRTARGCVDAELSLSGDARPQVTFVGDTLVVVDQAVIGDRGTTYVRFLAPPASCR